MGAGFGMELFIKLHPVMTIVYIQLIKTISYIAHYLVTTIAVVLIKFDEPQRLSSSKTRIKTQVCDC